MNVRITVNGTPHERDVEPRTLLVYFLREHLGLTGTHVGCDSSHCGACTVVLDGSRAVKSCNMFAVMADGHEVTTVEGLEQGGKLHAIQQAFTDNHGLQCGYCTPGMMMTSYVLLQHQPDPSEGEIRAAIAGNLCRCTGYNNIVKSVRSAASELASRKPLEVTAETAEVSS